jgi:hypothetical protein
MVDKSLDVPRELSRRTSYDVAHSTFGSSGGTRKSYITPDFGLLPDELCIRSICFSEEATKLCLAIKNSELPLSRLDRVALKTVLRAAGKYTILPNESRSTTPEVIVDLTARGLDQCWDRLPITANCCQYPIRLDKDELQRLRCSVSASMLAMCLLNGEILHNGRGRRLTFPNGGNQRLSPSCNGAMQHMQ